MHLEYVGLSALLVIATVLFIRGYNPFTAFHRKIEAGDPELIRSAWSLEELKESQQLYIAAMGRRLQAHMQGYNNNSLMSGMASAFVLAANYLSVGITGTGFVECDQAKSLAFTINLIAALIAGLQQLFMLERSAQNNLSAASRLRAEFYQFLGESQEYAGLDIPGRYSEFTKQTDKLIQDDILAEQGLHTSQKEAKEKTKKTADDMHRSEEGRT